METALGYPPQTVTVFLSMVAMMILFDLFSHRKDEVVSLSSAVRWSIFYIACAGAFAGYLFVEHGSEAASLFLTGYALEKVLAFDNLFVFSLVFTFFRLPENQQHKALYWGIAGAIIFRLIFVLLGVSFLDSFGKYVEVAFAMVILYTVWLMWQALGEDENLENYNETWYVKGIKKIYPAASTFFIAVVTIEISDILFSFDSVPAIIAVTKEPLLIYASMIFAILGLRSLYFVISGISRYFIFMDEAVIIVLLLIALKLLLGAFGFHVDPLLSLSIILSVLLGGVVSSLIFKGDD